MKKVFLLSLLFLLPLASCGGDNVPPDANPSDDDKIVNTTPNQNSTPAPQEDFTIKTSENDVFVEKETYVFTKANPNGEYSDLFDDFEIDITLPGGYKWHVTDESLIKISLKIEDESILKPDAITFDFTHQYSSNYITKATAHINREKILKAGKTKVKIDIQDETTSSHNATLCFELDIKEYGQILVDTFNNTKVTLDKDSLKEKMKNYTDVTVCRFVISDPESEYGYSADGYIANNIDPKTLEGNYSSTFKFAKGHIYEVWVYVEGKDQSNEKKMDYLYFNEDSTSPDKYKVTVTANGNSSLEVFADNTDITLTLK